MLPVQDIVNDMDLGSSETTGDTINDEGLIQALKIKRSDLKFTTAALCFDAKSVFTIKFF